MIADQFVGRPRGFKAPVSQSG